MDCFVLALFEVRQSGVSNSLGLSFVRLLVGPGLVNYSCLELHLELQHFDCHLYLHN